MVWGVECRQRRYSLHLFCNKNIFQCCAGCTGLSLNAVPGSQQLGGGVVAATNSKFRVQGQEKDLLQRFQVSPLWSTTHRRRRVVLD